MHRDEVVYTLMVVPDANSPTCSWQLPLRWVRLAGFTLTVLACFILLLAFDYQQARVATKQLDQLSSDFREQEQQLLVVARQAEALEKDIVAIRELDQTVRDMMQLSAKDSEVEEAGTTAQLMAAQTYLVNRGGLAATILNAQRGLQNVSQSIPESKETLETLAQDITKQQAKERATPSTWPTSGRITSPYGYRISPFGYSRQFHSGLDIGAKRGTAIYATADGKVSFAGYQGGYGYVVYINHGYGFTTVYAHMSKLGAKSGQSVNRGDLIGYVGSSGRSTGPHLHYEVHIDGSTVNPRPYMK